MRKILASLIVGIVFFSVAGVSAARNEEADKESLSNSCGVSIEHEMHELTQEFLFGVWSGLPFPPGDGYTTSVSFRENGQCKVFWPAQSIDAVMSGTWQVAGGALVLTLGSQTDYEREVEEEIDPPMVIAYALGDLQEMTREARPTKKQPLFDGVATELRREYFTSGWLDMPVAFEGPYIDLSFQENGEFVLDFRRANWTTTEEYIAIQWGTWQIVDNKLEVTITHQEKRWGGVVKSYDELGSFAVGGETTIEEFSPPVIQTHEIIDLQYVLEIPKDYPYMNTFTEWYIEQCLGEMMTMHFQGIQFWCWLHE